MKPPPTWMGKHSATLLPWAVFAIALLIRFVYLLQGLDAPFFRVPVLDAATYDDLARRIAAGQVGLPLFWQPIFYPVFLGTIYSIVGPNVLAAKILQSVLGAATCALTAAVGARTFSRATGAAAGLMAAAYGPLVFFDGELLGEGWAVFWCILVLWRLLHIKDDTRPASLLGTGACCALAVLTRPTFIPALAGGVIVAAAGLLLRGRPAAALCHGSTGRFTFMPFSGGLVKKTDRFFCSREIPRNSDLYLSRDYSSLMRGLAWKFRGFGFPFGAVFPLAFIGLAARRRAVQPLCLPFLLLYHRIST